MVYCLCLPPKLAIYDILYTSLLKPHHGSILSHPVIVTDVNAAEY